MMDNYLHTEPYYYDKEQDEDIVLAARRALEEDDRESRAIFYSDAEDDQQNPIKRDIQSAAMAAGGGLAEFVLGAGVPVFGALAAGGIALAATTKGKAGEVARASGHVILSASDRLLQSKSRWLRYIFLTSHDRLMMQEQDDWFLQH